MRKPTQNIDYTSRDYEAYRELMLQKLREKIPEYTDTSQTDAGIVLLECLANGLDILSLYNDVIANDILLSTTQDRKMACILAENLGYTPYNQTASITPMVFVLNKEKDTQTLIPKGTIVSTNAEDNQVAMTFETVEDLVIPSGCLGDEFDEDSNYLYTVNVAHGSTIRNDLIGTSSETPYQQLKLNFKKVLTDSITLYVNEGSGSKQWKQVSSFLDSGVDENSRVYTVSVDEFDNCYVTFGDGVHGHIPTAQENGITASYRIGGGASGNVQANTITKLVSSIGVVDHVFNPVSSTTLGHDKEPIEEIKYNAPASFRTRDRAVTLQDYSDLIKINNKGNLFGILSSIAIRDSDIHTKANLYCQMRDGYELTKELEEEIHTFFSTRTMVGTTLEIFPYTPQVIDIEATLIINNDYDKAELTNYVTSYVKDTFFGYGQFSFEDEFLKSDLEGQVKETFDGVRSFRINTPLEDIVVPSSKECIITLGRLTLNVIGGKD